MILAIDETGDFKENSDKMNFFVGVRIRQQKEFFELKKYQFNNWENSIPRSYKNHKGEIKSSILDNKFLHSFVTDVMIQDPILGISPVSIIPKDNPKDIIDKHRAIQLAGINNGVLEYLKLGKKKHAHTYRQFANWLRKLSYEQYIKIILLGICIVDSLRNAIGHSITGEYDQELVDTKYLVDEIFLKGLEQNSFWHEILRNQLYAYTQKSPIPLLDEWQEKGHPFLDKYAPNGVFNLNELFWKNFSFVKSHDSFEVRIADTTCTIISKYFNQNELKETYDILKYCIDGKGHIHGIVLNDFDFEYRIGDIKENPWEPGNELNIFE